MADNYTENSELVRERATEDLFNRDAAPKHSQEHEAEELGSGLKVGFRRALPSEYFGRFRDEKFVFQWR